jgi:hypothetical protein
MDRFPAAFQAVNRDTVSEGIRPPGHPMQIGAFPMASSGNPYFIPGVNLKSVHSVDIRWTGSGIIISSEDPSAVEAVFYPLENL